MNALDGAPGIYSARWAGEPRDFNVAMDRVQKELMEKETEDYSASFSALALVVLEHKTEKVFRRSEGEFIFPAQGWKRFWL